MLKTEESAQTTDARRLPSPERHLTVSPLDMRQPRFGTAMRGFDKNEVTAFLEEASTDYENALRENERLRGEIIRLEASLNQFRELTDVFPKMQFRQLITPDYPVNFIVRVKGAKMAGRIDGKTNPPSA